MTRRRWIADTWSPESGHPTHAALTGEQAVHLARVLRAQPGQVYDIVANGFLHRAEVAAVSDAEVSFVLHEELEADAALPIHLLLAVFKFDHFEWAVEKATELGVARITPILARRTEKHLGLAAAKRVERWRRIALESAKQSRRTDIPEIAEPMALAAALAMRSCARPHPAQRNRTDRHANQCAANARVPHRAASPRWVRRQPSTRQFPSGPGDRPGRRMDSRRDGRCSRSTRGPTSRWGHAS